MHDNFDAIGKKDHERKGSWNLKLKSVNFTWWFKSRIKVSNRSRYSIKLSLELLCISLEGLKNSRRSYSLGHYRRTFSDLMAVTKMTSLRRSLQYASKGHVTYMAWKFFPLFASWTELRDSSSSEMRRKTCRANLGLSIFAQEYYTQYCHSFNF